ncbi:MAG: hypothetical protein IJL26_07300 [Clostridia bacterium]|nr:hypothetical protein [Clostridia bacterium]
MVFPVFYQTEDGKTVPSFHVSGYYPYDYFYADVSSREEYAAILDRILSKGCIPRWMANDFAACFVGFVAEIEASRSDRPASSQSE